MIAIRDAVRADASLLLAYIGKKSELDRSTGAFAGAARGFALYYFRYSSFAGQPSLDRARHHDCTHLGWTAAVANPRGIAFYERAGAVIVARDDKQVTFRLAL